MEALKYIGAIISLFGSIFLFLGALGLIRMPDVYNRIQAGTKASTLGTILTLLGIGLIMPSWGGKLFILIMFVIITNPVSSHVLSRAAHHIGVNMYKNTVTDLLEKDENNTNSKPEKQ
ncbi:MAG TPA: monovalent cation/H(+) antiporter subunit G [Bacteroidales bacterium]|jgi:multicomponent Na+:H+ antiporter subunit G|nr:monovalent cation/H(+) antiporter subunit G [Bacteroidales bacterium]MDD4235635.1 monovalent cation/H(+) antiporter subunit G [Bacteroidales bacterium]MDY0160064.1 monovalent cation/H(+) antiporter subunit G [Bacteroidales bacterium]HXK81246.1 monovalent cation/H(+) antiporter subunit G [Bacteroidales bacterium]